MPAKIHWGSDGRTCTKCGTFKGWGEFAKSKKESSGHEASCKACRKSYFDGRKAAKAGYDHEYHAARKSERNRYCLAWHKQNRKRQNAYKAARRKADPEQALIESQRSRIGHALRGVYKAAHTIELLGCTPAELRAHLEALFKPGMTWANRGHGKGRWTVDHVLACATFDLTDPAQQRECFHYTNLQPMWFEENSGKGARPAAFTS